MGRWVRSCLQSVLKVMNSVIGLAGMGMILYSLWMIRSWYSGIHDSPFGVSEPSPSWFIYTFLGLGIFLCLITCSEAAITADIFLNKNWEEDFPQDPTGKFDELKDFVKSNFEMCKWIGLLIVAAQALSIFLSMILRAFGPDTETDYDSDDDTIPARLPLLRSQSQQTYRAADSNSSMNKDTWNVANSSTMKDTWNVKI